MKSIIDNEKVNCIIAISLCKTHKFKDQRKKGTQEIVSRIRISGSKNYFCRYIKNMSQCPIL